MSTARQLIEERYRLHEAAPADLQRMAKVYKGTYVTTNTKGGTLTYWFEFWSKEDASSFIELVDKYGDQWNPSDEPSGPDVNGNWRVSVI